MKIPKLLCLVGPTGSGKTELSLTLAEQIPQTELIYADSLAVYRYLDVGTAKPSREAREKVPHHLVDFLDPCMRWSAFAFKREVMQLVPEITWRGNLPVVVGGTAFYLQSLWQEPLFEGIPTNRSLRLSLAHLSSEKIFALLKSIDPSRAQKIGKHDRRRLIRALEIFLGSGHLPSAKKKKALPPFTPLFFGIHWEKEVLKKRIIERTKNMFRQGLVEEVEALFARGYTFPLPALENFTYLPVVELLYGKITANEAKERIVKGTLLFVKRQMNWFRKWPITWFCGEHSSWENMSREIYLSLEKQGIWG